MSTAISNVDGIQGHLNRQDCQNLFKIGQALPDNARCIEIGSLRGLSAYLVHLGAKQAKKNIKIYCIDMWEADELEPESGIPNAELLDDAYTFFLKNIIDKELPFTPMKGNSNDFYGCFEPNSIDYLFIDGAHDYTQVLLDLKHYFPLLKKDGVCLMHDCTPNSDVYFALIAYSRMVDIKYLLLKHTCGLVEVKWN